MSLYLTFVLVFVIFVVPVSLYPCCCWLPGGLVCMVLFRWVVFITMVSVVLMFAGLLHVHGNCFHQIVMIAFRKIRHPLSFLPRELRVTVVLVCVCFVFK